MHTGLPVGWRWAWAVLLLSVQGCGRAQLQTPDSGEVMVEPAEVMPVVVPQDEAIRSAPSSLPLAVTGNRNGYWPVALRREVTVSLQAGVARAVELPVSASAESAVLSVTSRAPTTLTVGGADTQLQDGSAHAQLLVPLAARSVTVSSSSTTELALMVVAVFDQTGAGLELVSEASQRIELSSPQQVYRVADVKAEERDAWGRWITVTAWSERASHLDIFSCDGPVLEALAVDNAKPSSVVTLVPSGDLCVRSDQPAQVEVVTTARYRRFTMGSMQRVVPLVILDTPTGVAWHGRPRAGQVLDVTLSSLASSLVLLALQPLGASAEDLVDVGPCGGALTRTSAMPRLMLHDPARPLCVSPSGAFDLRVSVVGLMSSQEAMPSMCPARPAAKPCAGSSLAQKLNCLPGVTASDEMQGIVIAKVKQPVDHSQPDGPQLEQRIRVRQYGGAGAPWVLHTGGYVLASHVADVTAQMTFNEVTVEHRFFGDSKPEASLGEKYLDIVQSAQDSHRLVELLRPVLGGVWLGSGHSKGGETALFHRRFFPCDVEATVAYVTPINTVQADPRYEAALQTLGGPTYERCRAVFRELDRAVIRDRQRLQSQLVGTYSAVGGKETALWSVVGQTSWGLFQYGNLDHPTNGCPGYTALLGSPNFNVYVEYIAKTAEAMSDEQLRASAADIYYPYIYQTTNELGEPHGTWAAFADIAPVPRVPLRGPLVVGRPVRFESRAMPDILRWVAVNGERLMFVYGEHDPWSAGAVPLGGARDSFRFDAPRANHGAGLDELTPADALRAVTVLRRWTGTVPAPSSLSSATQKLVRFRDVMERDGL